MVRVSTAGLRRFEPNTWSMMAVSATNTRDEDQELVVALYFADDSSIQYARRFWVPAGARRYTWVPVHIPFVTRPGSQLMNYTMLTLQEQNGREVVRRAGGQAMFQESPLLIDQETSKTATIFSDERRTKQQEQDDWDFYEHVIVKGRTMLGLSRVTIEMADVNFGLAPLPQTLESLDQIIIADDRITQDSAGLAAIRRWLTRGGRVWLPLDRLSPEVVAEIIGHRCEYEEVDRVELNAYRIEDLTEPSEENRFQECEWEEPVVLARVLTDATDIHCRIDGWPAAFWVPVGQGEALCTTLSARGWARATDGHPTRALKSISSRLYLPVDQPPPPAEMVEPVLREQIGYHILSHRFAGSMLIAHCLVLVAAALWLGWRRRLEVMALIVPITGVVMAVVLVVVGHRHARQVAPAAVATHLVDVTPATGEAHVQAIAALYHQQTVPLSLELQNGIADFVHRPVGSVTRRMEWDDNGSTSWRNVELPSSTIQLARVDTTAQLGQPLVAIGVFGEDGLNGRLLGQSGHALEDVVIYQPPAFPLAVDLRPDGTFVSGPGDVLVPGEFLAARLLSDEQRRRQELMRRLLDPQDDFVFPHRTTLFAWSEPLDIGLDFPPEMERREDALMAIPVELKAPKRGTTFVVPASFLRTLSAMGRSGRSSVFNPQTARWLPDVTSATETRLAFQLPVEARPCRVVRARVTLKLHIPSRELEIAGYRQPGGERVSLKRWENPSGLVTLDIDQADVLQLDKRGSIQLDFSVSKVKRGGNGGDFRFDAWRIDYVRVDLTAEKL